MFILLINFIFFIKWDINNLLNFVIKNLILNDLLMISNSSYNYLINLLIFKKLIFYSKNKKYLWFKGFFSKNMQYFKYFYIDCDMDYIVFKILNLYNISCHTFNKNCFLNFITI